MIKLLAIIAVACSVWVVARTAGAQELCDWDAIATYDEARWLVFYRNPPLGSLNTLLFVEPLKAYWVYTSDQ